MGVFGPKKDMVNRKLWL